MKSHSSVLEANRVHEQSKSPRGVRRTLDGFEEHFWLKEQIVRCGHILAADVEGATTLDQWQIAFAALQKAYPVLSVSILKEDGARPLFYSLVSAPQLLSIQPLSACASLESRAEEILLLPFRDGEPLVRAYLFFSDSRCCIFLHAHHAALDGRSHLLLFHDLIAHLATQTEPATQDFAPSLASLVNRNIEPYQPADEPSTVPQTNMPSESRVLRISNSHLTGEETQELVRRAKHERCSVHSAVLATLAISGCELNPDWQASDIVCVSPFDVRRFFGMQRQVGQLIALHRVVLRMSDRKSVWSIARQISSTMKADQLRAELPSFVKLWQSLTRHEMVATGKPFFAHDLMLASYGSQTVESQIGHLTIRSIFTAGHTSGPTAQKFSALTVGGSLGLTHVAIAPLPGMLELAHTILRTVGS